MIAAPLPIPTRGFGRGSGPPATAGGGNVATPAPTPANAGIGKPFVERVPEAAGVSDRLRRHAEKVAVILNSLMASGVLVQTGPSSWTIDAGAISDLGGLTADGHAAGHYGA